MTDEASYNLIQRFFCNMSKWKQSSINQVRNTYTRRDEWTDWQTDRRTDVWMVDCVWNVMAHAQKPDFVFLRNGRVHLNRQGRQFSRLPAAELCASAVVMLDTPCFEVVWRVLATHSIRQFPFHFPSYASPCAITFQMESNSAFINTRWSCQLHCHWHDS